MIKYKTDYENITEVHCQYWIKLYLGDEINSEMLIAKNDNNAGPCGFVFAVRQVIYIYTCITDVNNNC